MPDQDIDRLFFQLRQSAPPAPAHLTSEIIARLGPSARSVHFLLVIGSISCIAAVLVSVGISLETVHRSHSGTPPALALFSTGFGPISTP